MKPKFAKLGTLTCAVCDAIAAEPRRSSPNQTVLDLIRGDTPDDVAALLTALAHHAPDSVTSSPGWDFFETWDLRFTQVERLEDAICIGASADGNPYLAGVADGRTVILDGTKRESGPIADSLDSFFNELLMWADDEVDSTLKEFVPEGEPWEW